MMQAGIGISEQGIRGDALSLLRTPILQRRFQRIFSALPDQQLLMYDEL